MLARTLLLTLALTACAKQTAPREAGEAADRTDTTGTTDTTDTETTTPTGTTESEPATPGTEGTPEKMPERMDKDMGAYTPVTDPASPSSKPADHLVAVVYGTDDDDDIKGEVHLRRVAQGVQVEVEMDQIPSGTYAYAVHTYGDCSDPGNQSAGPALDFDRLTGATGDMGMRGSMGHDSLGGGPTDPMGTAGTPGATGTGTTGTTGPEPLGGEPRDDLPKPGMDKKTADTMPGELGTFTATGGKLARQTATLPNLKGELVGILNGRSIVLERKAMTGTTDTPDAGDNEVVGCGVIGVAREPTSPPTPAMTVPERAREDVVPPTSR